MTTEGRCVPDIQFSASTLLRIGVALPRRAALAGLAPGPLIVGMLSDLFGLKLALTLTLTPVLALALAAAVFFALTSRNYEADAARSRARGAQAA